MIAQEDTSNRQRFNLKVMVELLTEGVILGLKPDDMIEFFSVQVEAMLLCPPNYRMYKETARVWILRGYYPNSPLFFKLVLVDSDKDGKSGYQAKYFAKATSLRMNWRSPRGRSYEDHITINAADIAENITNKMENEFFGAKHQLKELFAKKIKMPKCMSPKGMRLYRFDKPSKGKKRAKTKS